MLLFRCLSKAIDNDILILYTRKRALWQTVKTLMKCRIVHRSSEEEIQHFEGSLTCGYSVCTMDQPDNSVHI